MAIEVIGVDVSVFRESTCRQCAARLRYTMSDRQQRLTSDYTGDRDIFYFVVCPKCQSEVPAVRHL